MHPLVHSGLILQTQVFRESGDGHLDGVFGHHPFGGNGGIGIASGNESQDIQLRLGEGKRRSFGSTPIGIVRRIHNFGHKLIEIANRRLQQIPRSLRK